MSKNKDEIMKLHRACYDFFMDYVSKDDHSFGLFIDNTAKLNVATIAGTGFYLSALVIGVTSGYLDKTLACQHAKKTFNTLLTLDNYHGFFCHYYDIDTRTRHKKSEYSTIDTWLCLAGVICAKEFFGDEELSEMSNFLIDRVDYKDFVINYNGKPCLAMSYNEIENGDYTKGNPGYIYHWHMLAEQIMGYLFISGKLDEETSNALYEGFERKKGSYGGISYCHSPENSLFVYMYSNLYIGQEKLRDKHGFSWYQNTKSAVLANLKYCSDMGYDKETFGISACEGKYGYRVYGCPPREGKDNSDGTILLGAFAGGLPYLKDDMVEAFIDFSKRENVSSKYGLYTSYNYQTKYVSKTLYAIDKGLEFLSYDMYLYETIVRVFLNSPYIKKGMKVLGWHYVND